MTGWFEEQIELRKQKDIETFEDSCLKIAGSVMGQSLSAALQNERDLVCATGILLKILFLLAGGQQDSGKARPK